MNDKANRGNRSVGGGDDAGLPILDVRPAHAFLAGHRRGAVNIPLEELLERVHELPPRDAACVVYDDKPTRARWAASRLRARGRDRVLVRSGSDWLIQQDIATGNSRVRLWQPHPLLVESLELARTYWPLFAGRRAIDLACGTGRDAIYLAMAGFDVDACDLLPDALERCRALAARHEVLVNAFECDLERDPRLDAGRYDLVSCFNFLHRPLLPHIAAALAPGGLLIYETFVDPQREAYGKPSRESHVLKRGELKSALADLDHLELLVYREGLTATRRHAASLIGRKRPET